MNIYLFTPVRTVERSLQVIKYIKSLVYNNERMKELKIGVTNKFSVIVDHMENLAKVNKVVTKTSYCSEDFCNSAPSTASVITSVFAMAALTKFVF